MNASGRYDSLIRYYAELRGLDWHLVKAQIRQESNFDPDARSWRGALGLMQFMPRTWEEWRDATPGIQPPPDAGKLIDPRDPEDSISSGTSYMRWLLDYPAVGGDIERALAAYNWGIGNLRTVVASHGERWRSQIPAEPENYITKIRRYWLEYAAEPDPAGQLDRLRALHEQAGRVLGSGT